MYEVLDNNQLMVARCHAYVKPDGSYGGSGHLDPKEVRVGNDIWYIDPPVKIPP
jgi:hypothetical protein